MDNRLRGKSTTNSGAATLFMTTPFISIVVETISLRCQRASGSIADGLNDALKAIEGQTYPAELRECIIVLDREIAESDAAEICRRYATAKFISALASNYFAAKNVGAAAAAGSVVAFVDGDCVPAPDWLEKLSSAFGPEVAAVGGRSQYAGTSWEARTFSIPDFGYVLAENGGVASGISLSNVAFCREVLLSHPLETRIRRDGGCYLLFHQLRAEGARIVHEPRALTYHGLDFRGLGFARKHFNRGYDGVAVYELDDRLVLRGTIWLQRLGAVGLVGITVRRIARDWMRVLRHRRQIGVPLLALPYFYVVAVVTRTIEMVGGLMALAAKKRPRWEM